MPRARRPGYSNPQAQAHLSYKNTGSGRPTQGRGRPRTKNINRGATTQRESYDRPINAQSGQYPQNHPSYGEQLYAPNHMTQAAPIAPLKAPRGRPSTHTSRNTYHQPSVSHQMMAQQQQMMSAMQQQAIIQQQQHVAMAHQRQMMHGQMPDPGHMHQSHYMNPSMVPSTSQMPSSSRSYQPIPSSSRTFQSISPSSQTPGTSRVNQQPVLAPSTDNINPNPAIMVPKASSGNKSDDPDSFVLTSQASGPSRTNPAAHVPVNPSAHSATQMNQGVMSYTSQIPGMAGGSRTSQSMHPSDQVPITCRINPTMMQSSSQQPHPRPQIPVKQVPSTSRENLAFERLQNDTNEYVYPAPMTEKELREYYQQRHEYIKYHQAQKSSLEQERDPRRYVRNTVTPHYNANLNSQLSARARAQQALDYNPNFTPKYSPASKNSLVPQLKAPIEQLKPPEAYPIRVKPKPEVDIDFSDLPAGFFEDISSKSSNYSLSTMSSKMNAVVRQKKSAPNPRIRYLMVDPKSKEDDHWTSDAPLPPEYYLIPEVISERAKSKFKPPWMAGLEPTYIKALRQKKFKFARKVKREILEVMKEHCPYLQFPLDKYLTIHKRMDDHINMRMAQLTLALQELVIEEEYEVTEQQMDNFYETLIMHAIFGLYSKQKTFQNIFLPELINLNDDSELMKILTEMPKYLKRRDHVFRFYAETHLLRIKDTQKRIIYVYQEVPSETSRLQQMKPYIKAEKRSTEKPIWAHVFYFEFHQKLGDTYEARGNILNITGSHSDNYGDPKSGVVNVHLGRIVHAHRSYRTHRVRKDIDMGITLIWTGWAVFLRINRAYPIFLQCPLYAIYQKQKMDHIFRIQNERNKKKFLKIWDRRLFNYFKDKATGQASYKQIYDLKWLAVIRISFLKGFGHEKYPRKTIDDVPAWVEIQLSQPLWELTIELRDMYNTDPPDSDDENDDIESLYAYYKGKKAASKKQPPTQVPDIQILEQVQQTAQEQNQEIDPILKELYDYLIASNNSSEASKNQENQEKTSTKDEAGPPTQPVQEKVSPQPTHSQQDISMQEAQQSVPLQPVQVQTQAAPSTQQAQKQAFPQPEVQTQKVQQSQTHAQHYAYQKQQNTVQATQAQEQYAYQQAQAQSQQYPYQTHYQAGTSTPQNAYQSQYQSPSYPQYCDASSQFQNRDYKMMQNFNQNMDQFKYDEMRRDLMSTHPVQESSQNPGQYPNFVQDPQNFIPNQYLGQEYQNQYNYQYQDPNQPGSSNTYNQRH